MTIPKQAWTDADREGLNYLASLGATFVAARFSQSWILERKKPKFGGKGLANWSNPDKRMGSEEAWSWLQKDQYNRVGILPPTVGLIGVDIDGDPEPSAISSWLKKYPPIARVPSGTAGRYHLIYPRSCAPLKGWYFSKKPWNIDGLSGDLYILPNGWMCIYHAGGIAKWADAAKRSTSEGKYKLPWILMNASKEGEPKQEKVVGKIVHKLDPESTRLLIESAKHYQTMYQQSIEDEYQEEYWERETIIAALNWIDPDIKYDWWYRFGLALCNWGDPDAFKIWDEWSSHGSKYKPGECEKHWRRFRPLNRVTLGTLIYISRKFKAYHEGYLDWDDIMEYME